MSEENQLTQDYQSIVTQIFSKIPEAPPPTGKKHTIVLGRREWATVVEYLSFQNCIWFMRTPRITEREEHLWKAGGPFEIVRMDVAYQLLVLEATE